MSSTFNTVVKVPNLTSTNYDTWKTKMEMLLIRERLWPIVCERRKRPEGEKSDDDLTKAQEKYDDDAERAAATIFLYLDDTAERHVQDVQDLVELWQKLKEVFATTGFSTRYILWQQLFTIQAGPYGSISKYVDEVKTVSVLRHIMWTGGPTFRKVSGG